MTATRRSYDLVADRYAAEIGDELRGKPFDRALLATTAELAGDGPLLDVGCGPGHVTAHLAGLGAQALGVDLSPGMCAVARRRTTSPFGVGDMTALPVRSGSVAAIVCLYAVIHLDPAGRAAAYAEFARVLRPGGHALIAFHTGDAGTATGGRLIMDRWWDQPVDLTFHYPDPAAESVAMSGAGLLPVARLDRAPHPGEHPSTRSYLVVRTAGAAG